MASKHNSVMAGVAGYSYACSYTLTRGDVETDGEVYFNVQREEPATRDYPGCPAAVEDLIFVARGAEIELTPAEEKAAEEQAWEHLRDLG
jgi:hypothetical protein